MQQKQDIEIEEDITGWGGKRPGSGRKRKSGRQRLMLSKQAAKDLYRLTRYRRARFDNKELTEEDVVAALVDQAWQEILDAHEGEDIEELKEPYIL